MHGKAGFASIFLAIPLYDLDDTSKLTRGMVIPCRMQNLKSVAALDEKLGRKEAKWKTTIWCEALSSRSLAAARLPKAPSSTIHSSDDFDP